MMKRVKFVGFDLDNKLLYNEFRMKLVIKKPKLENWILYITLACYVIDIGNLKYVIAMIGAITMFGIAFLSKSFNNTFAYEFKCFLFSIIGLTLITIIQQIINGFNSYAINEVIYFITPLFFTFAYLQVNRGIDIDHVLNVILFIYIINFFIENFSTLSLSGLLSISFADSYSPYESGLPMICVVYMIYFFKKNKLVNVFFLWILNYITLKRLSFVFASVVLAIMIIRKLFNLILHTNRTFNINKKISYIIVIFFILLPIILYSLLNDDFQQWFYDLTGVDIDVFMLSRFTRMEEVAHNPDFINTGLGSTTVYLTGYYQSIHTHTLHDNFNLHNDIFKIFIECGLIGTIIFTICYFKATKFKPFSVLLMTYVFSEMIVNHLLGAGTVAFWIVVYLILYALSRPTKIAVEDKSHRSVHCRAVRIRI